MACSFLLSPQSLIYTGFAMQIQATQFVSSQWSIPTEQFQVSVAALTGGLESAVGRATVSYDSPTPGPWPTRFVIKELRGSQRREVAVYRDLWSRFEEPPTARMYGTEAEGDCEFLYLENVETDSPWPWAQTTVSAAVCRALAHLHDSGFACPPDIDWDYEAELIHSAATTLEAAEVAGRTIWRRPGDLRRVVRSLARMRSEILDVGAIFIHGDVHPGNVIVRPADARQTVVLIDWARARVGSPLEDVASWLQSLGCWVPEARRRHDTLLRAYLEARAVPMKLTRELRTKYWFASASNGLSGAIRYHIFVLTNPAASEDARSSSRQALTAWERVIRQAASLLATTPRR
jgi:aminoglycoside phosphotransferase (APT) family kinase protein